MASRFHISPMRKVFLLLLLAGALGVTVLLVIGKLARKDYGQKVDSTPIYGKDVALDAMPEQLHPGYILLTAEQMTKAPIVDGFQSPICTPNGAFAYDAQPFGSPNPKRGGNHTGQDLNGIGGSNTDEGEPVYAAARGLVVYSGVPADDWGNVVILLHRLPDGTCVQTFYAHLKERSARPGETVSRGEPIGTIGTANGLYLAHLHFEAIPSRCVEAGMPAYDPKGTMNRIDPQELMKKYPAPAFPDPYGAVRMLRKREAGQAAPAAAPAESLPEGVAPVNPTQFL